MNHQVRSFTPKMYYTCAACSGKHSLPSWVWRSVKVYLFIPLEVGCEIYLTNYLWSFSFQIIFGADVPKPTHRNKTFLRPQRKRQHTVLWCERMCFIVVLCQLTENKSSESRGNTESILSNLIRCIIHWTCHDSGAKEMDTCCPHFYLLLGHQPASQPRHVTPQPHGGFLLGEVLKCYFLEFIFVMISAMPNVLIKTEELQSKSFFYTVLVAFVFRI